MAEVHEIASGLPSPAPGGVSTPPPDMPAKGKGRNRLLRGIQRISSTPSLNNGLRRSRSVGSPYSTRSTLSCVSLAATGLPQTPQTPQSIRSQTPLPSSTSSYFVDSPTTFASPLELSEDDDLAIRKVENGAPASGSASVALPSDLSVRARPGVRPVQRRTPFHFWDGLPNEVRIYIFSFLQPKELVRASRVSKAFYRSCFDGQLWKSLDASEYYRDIPAESLAKIILAAGPFIMDLNLRGCVQVEHYKRTEVIVKACKNLVNATLEGCQNFHKNTLHSLLRSNERLVSLNLTGLTAVSNAACKIIAESCAQLEAFNISWCGRVDARGVQAVVEGCTRLKDLRVGEVAGFDNLQLAQAIFETNGLERLVMSGCAELNDEALKTMMHGTDPEIDILSDLPEVAPRNLRHLDLSRCTRLTNAGVKSLGHLVPNLEGLQLSGCKLLSDAALEPILATTPRLTHLELEDLEGLTNSLLSEHLAKAPCATTLEHLSLSYCEGLGDFGLLPVMQKCTRLQSIDLDNTRISDLTLAEAAAMVQKRSTRYTNQQRAPRQTLQMVVYDCQNVTWLGIREVLNRNTQAQKVPGRAGQVSYPSEAIGLKCFYGFQMTVDEHQKRVLRNDLGAAGRLERKWADYMQANEEIGGAGGAGFRRRRRRAREAHALHLNEEDGGVGPNGRRRARTLGSCSVM